MRKLAVVAVLLLAGCGGGGGKIDAPAPPRDLAEAADTLPPMEGGAIVAPLAVDLASALSALERIVPAGIGDITKRLPMPLPRSRNATFAFEVRRDPFTVTFAGDTLLFRSVLHYKGRAWLATGLGALNGDCGIDEQPPRAQLVLRVVPSLTTQWQLKVNARVADLAPLTSTARDRCQVTFLNLNVTEKVLQAAREVLEKRLPGIQARIAGVDVKAPLERIWTELQEPIRLADSIWLLLSPGTIHLGPLSGSRQTVNASLGMTAAPRIVTGSKPNLPPLPLPPLNTTRLETGFSLPIEGALDYQVMSDRLTRKLKGKSVKAVGGEFRILEATAYGIGAGRLAVGVEFEGTASGRVWLVGTPHYDQESGMITVPDLDFDASSMGLLIRGIAWIKGGAIREYLREHAQISAGELLDRLQSLAAKEMNRELANGVELEASIGASEPAAIVVGSRHVLVRARALGSARLLIGPEVFGKAAPNYGLRRAGGKRTANR